jgi:hypothetical protein
MARRTPENKAGATVAGGSLVVALFSSRRPATTELADRASDRRAKYSLRPSLGLGPLFLGDRPELAMELCEVVVEFRKPIPGHSHHGGVACVADAARKLSDSRHKRARRPASAASAGQGSVTVQPADMPARGSKNRQSSGQANGVSSLTPRRHFSSLSPDARVRVW